MTILAKCHRTWPAMPPITQQMNPLAFAAAFVLSPLVVGVAGFWALLIPVFAVVFGGIPYIVVGLPLALVFFGRIPTRFWPYAGLGLVGTIITFLALLVAGLLNSASPDATPREFDEFFEMAVFYLGFGLFFGPLWSGVFAVLYTAFTEQKSPQEGDAK